MIHNRRNADARYRVCGVFTHLLSTGIAVGVIVSVWVRPSVPLTDDDPNFVDFRYEQIVQRIADLEVLVNDLAHRLENPAEPCTVPDEDPQAESIASVGGVSELNALANRVRLPQSLGSREPEDSDRIIERLVAGGFSQSEAEEISRRVDELTMEATFGTLDQVRANVRERLP